MDFEEEGNLILFFGCFVNGRLKLHRLKLQIPRLKVDENDRSIHINRLALVRKHKNKQINHR